MRGIDEFGLQPHLLMFQGFPSLTCVQKWSQIKEWKHSTRQVFVHELDDQFKGVKNQLVSHFKTSKHPNDVWQVYYCLCYTSADHLAFLTDHPKVPGQWRSEEFMADTQLLSARIPPPWSLTMSALLKDPIMVARLVVISFFGVEVGALSHFLGRAVKLQGGIILLNIILDTLVIQSAFLGMASWCDFLSFGGILFW